MRKIMITTSAFLFSLTLATGASAAGGFGTDPKADSQQTQSSQNQLQQDQQLGSVQDQQEMGARAAALGIQPSDQIIGEAVLNTEGQKLGEISSLLVDLDSGQIGYARVSSGGVLGMGQEDHLVPWNALRPSEQEGFTLDISADRLKEAPKGKSVASREEARQINDFFGVAPYWEEQGGQEFEAQPQQAPPPLPESQGFEEERSMEGAQPESGSMGE